MLDYVTESWRTRRVKEEIDSFASVFAAFGPVGPFHRGNPGFIIRVREAHRPPSTHHPYENLESYRILLSIQLMRACIHRLSSATSPRYVGCTVHSHHFIFPIVSHFLLSR